MQSGDASLGTNMYAYCGNNPVNRSDPSGKLWKEIGDFLMNVLSVGLGYAQGYTGARATVVNQIAPPPIQIIPDPLPITLKMGSKTSTTTYSAGDSAKPILVYAQGRSDDYLVSSVGLNINVSDFRLNISLGLDNIGISGSIKDGNKTDSLGLKADLSQWKVGIEGASTIEWDANRSTTDYVNGSISGWAIAAAIIFSRTGQFIPSPQKAYS